MNLPLGFVLLLLGLLAWIIGIHFRARRYFDRPALARNQVFDPTVRILQWALLIGGLALLARSSVPIAASAGFLLTLGWGYRVFIRSVPFRRSLMRRDYESLKRARPDLSQREILFRMVMASHPRWGEELVEQMVDDNQTVESLARIVAKMERGFRGFR